MTGRRQSAVSVPEDTLLILALDALVRYRARELSLPSDSLFSTLVDRLGGDADAE
ncbi:MAG TPA: hypothetical protein VGG75_14025 [Trebonia sp.]|jgi:hypothetical protein